MNQRTRFAFVLVAAATAFLPAAFLSAQTSQPAAPPNCALPDLAWLAGEWEGTDSRGVTTGEVWLAPRGGAMFGVNRAFRGDLLIGFEYLRITEPRQGEMNYIAGPQGKPPTIFKLSECSSKTVAFFNPDNEFPKEIRYWLDDTGTLHASIDNPGEKNRRVEWRWNKKAN